MAKMKGVKAQNTADGEMAVESLSIIANIIAKNNM